MASNHICERTKKKIFPNKLEADLALARIRMKNSRRRQGGDHRPEPRYTYHCEFGDHWHLGGTRPQMESKV